MSNCFIYSERSIAVDRSSTSVLVVSHVHVINWVHSIEKQYRKRRKGVWQPRERVNSSKRRIVCDTHSRWHKKDNLTSFFKGMCSRQKHSYDSSENDDQEEEESNKAPYKYLYKLSLSPASIGKVLEYHPICGMESLVIFDSIRALRDH